ncbi:MAG: hypothetical protein QGI29_04655, partial [Pirellulales bacterium]|nr:hypothetical protein [Pirellulales bacterium]
MTDRILFELADGWALGHDKRQWMIMRARNRRGERDWQPVSFIASEKRILERCIREKGIQPTSVARSKLNTLPNQFRDWIALQN